MACCSLALIVLPLTPFQGPDRANASINVTAATVPPIIPSIAASGGTTARQAALLGALVVWRGGGARYPS